ncbi:MAG: hypothetical protein PHW32_04105, partial [Bacilli bacterium]|nr:hypothetical protein [Bacilli bacterium]MDD4718818.1 hypothetical protein [Bacilli bacterium]
MPSSDSTSPYLNGPIKRNEIESIKFATTYVVPNDALESWDVSFEQDGSVMAWCFNENGDGLY